MIVFTQRVIVVDISASFEGSGTRGLPRVLTDVLYVLTDSVQKEFPPISPRAVRWFVSPLPSTSGSDRLDGRLVVDARLQTMNQTVRRRRRSNPARGRTRAPARRVASPSTITSSPSHRLFPVITMTCASEQADATLLQGDRDVGATSPTRQPRHRLSGTAMVVAAPVSSPVAIVTRPRGERRDSPRRHSINSASVVTTLCNVGRTVQLIVHPFAGWLVAPPSAEARDDATSHSPASLPREGRRNHEHWCQRGTLPPEPTPTPPRSRSPDPPRNP